MAVIVIVVILFLIVVPVFNNVITRARYGAFGSSKKSIERAAELYYASNADKIIWDNNISYIEVGTLKSKKYLKKNVINLLNNMNISDDTKILLYKKGKGIEYSLQLYNDEFFTWYQEEMIKGSKKDKNNLPVNVGDKRTIELATLMEKGLTDELRLPLSLEDRCVGYVEIEKTGNSDYNYDAYVDCLTKASTFASHYVSYGGINLDEFLDVKETSDGGFVAVGRSNSEKITKYGIGNNGKYDAIIVKFNPSGEVEWSKNFGGSNNDIFNAVVEVSGGYVVTGETSSADGDIINYKGGTSDALIAKYDYNGTIIMFKTFGTSGPYDRFINIELNDNKVIATGMMSNVLDGDLSGITTPKGIAYFGIKVVFDNNINLVELKAFDLTYNSVFYRSIISGKNYITTGYVVSSNSEYANGKKCDIVYNTAGVLVSHGENFSNEKYTIFCGAGTTYLYNAVEVDDGYIAIGYSSAIDLDMAGLSKASNGKYDAIIVKYDKALDNIIWKKSFGGSNDDEFRSIIKVNSNEIIVVGNSKSNDMDMLGISKANDMDMLGISKANEGYSNAILVKYNSNNGNILDTKVFGGSNSERFTSAVKTKNNQYLLAGSNYSSDKDLKIFNKGHNDAIISKYDNNLNLDKTLKEPVVLIEKLKKIAPNYGTAISLEYNNIYTTNDPTKDLMGWCSSNSGTDTYEQNYVYGQCLRPFNVDDMKMLTKIERSNNSVKNVFAGEHEYSIEIEPDQFTNWYRIWFYLINSGEVEISNLKLKFSDGYVGSIRDASQNGYISNLVVVSNDLYPTIYHAPNPIKIIETNQSVKALYMNFYILLKPQKSKLTNLIFTTNKDVNGAAAGFNIHELRNFDMSITPTK